MDIENMTTVEAEDLTDIEVDDLLERYAAINRVIASFEKKRDGFISHYQAKIAKAQEICESECKAAKIEMELITQQLKRYAQTQVTDKRRSVQLPSGTLSFRRQAPRFFFDDLKEAKANDERLIRFVKHNAHEYLKVKVEEAVDWSKFKSKLQVSNSGEVFYSETGEFIEGLHAQLLPDSFTVKTSMER